MFFKDPSNNNLEFKSMSNPDYLFEKAVKRGKYKIAKFKIEDEQAPKL